MAGGGLYSGAAYLKTKTKFSFKQPGTAYLTVRFINYSAGFTVVEISFTSL